MSNNCFLSGALRGRAPLMHVETLYKLDGPIRSRKGLTEK